MSGRWSERSGRIGDLADVIAVKDALTLEARGASLAAGGFLLGTTPERYARLLEVGAVRLLLEQGRVVGFVIVLPDPILRASALWQRQEAIQWEGAPPDPALSVAYLDQLAVLPGLVRRAYGVRMATDEVRRVFAMGHERLFATTLVRPAINPAAIPHIERYGGRRVGLVDEVYPDGMQVTSVLYQVTRSAFEARAAGA